MDTQRAAALGLAGEQALVHAIDRGVRHSTRILGLLSARTVGSWWVPYEIAAGRCSEREVSFLVLESIRSMDSLPEYVRLAANYWSVDELVRWAAGLRSRPEAAVDVAGARLTALERYVPREPPNPVVHVICRDALDAIARLQAPEVWTALELTDRDQFDWLPTSGGIVRDIAYALLAPLALFQLGAPLALPRQRNLLRELYRSPTEHYEIAALVPTLPYDPERPGWRTRRYRTPASDWLQGLSPEQLHERLQQFVLVDTLEGGTRLATREEFKATFDRILRDRQHPERRALGVLVNPLMGFTPVDRPVYARILARQRDLLTSLAESG